MFKSLSKIVFCLFLLMFVTSLSYTQDDVHKHESDKSTEGIKMSDGTLYGKDYDVSMSVMDFTQLMSNPSDNDGKVILVKGDVAEVCQKMGCWLTMSDGTNTVRIKTLHEFFLPKDIAGKKAVVIGKFAVTEISEDQAKHYNDETNDPTTKTEDIKGPQKAFEIEAMGVKILNSPEGPGQNN